MDKVILRQEAINDLNSIWNYTFEKWSENQANFNYNTIKIACKEIGKNFPLEKYILESAIIY